MSGIRSWMGLAAGILLIAGALGMARADDLKTINQPGGGQIVYGPLTGVTSMQDGMVYVLRNVHGHFGERPQVGRFFQARDSHSVAAFFTVNAKRPDGSASPISGLAIVSMPEGSPPAAAVLFDDAARFGKSGPGMMKTLNKAWRADAARAGAGAGAGTVRELRRATGGDRSASIGLPAGWQLKSVAGGQLLAVGPNDEQVSLGLIFQQIRDAGVGGLVYPRNGDLFSGFVSIVNQVRRSRRLPPASYKLVSQQNLGRTQYEARVLQALFEADLHDGKGVRKGSARIGAMLTPGLPTWAMTVSGSNAPKSVADRENATMLAMIKSYSQDARVIAQETNAVIDGIHANARAAQIRADAQSAANDAHNRAFDAHMDNIDRYSKSFQNYQMDRAQVQDNDRNERATVDNGAADALTHIDSRRFQIVPTQDFIKGVDY